MTNVVNKVYEVDFKALGDGKGKFEAAFAVMGNVDLQGDRVMPGAFDETIKSWRDSGDPLPVIWNHDWSNPFSHIGTVDPKTLRISGNRLVGQGQIDMSNPSAVQVYGLMKSRAVKEFSFSYRILDERPGDDGANELWKLDLIEVGPTLKGANPATELLGVKAATVFGYKTQLENTISALQELLQSVEAGGNPPEEKASSPGETKTEEPAGANVEESTDEEKVRLRAEIARLS